MNGYSHINLTIVCRAGMCRVTFPARVLELLVCQRGRRRNEATAGTWLGIGMGLPSMLPSHVSPAALLQHSTRGKGGKHKPGAGLPRPSPPPPPPPYLTSAHAQWRRTERDGGTDWLSLAAAACMLEEAGQRGLLPLLLWPSSARARWLATKAAVAVAVASARGRGPSAFDVCTSVVFWFFE